jgi:hypothetical protein
LLRQRLNFRIAGHETRGDRGVIRGVGFLPILHEDAGEIVMSFAKVRTEAHGFTQVKNRSVDIGLHQQNARQI